MANGDQDKQAKVPDGGVSAAPTAGSGWIATWATPRMLAIGAFVGAVTGTVVGLGKLKQAWESITASPNVESIKWGECRANGFSFSASNSGRKDERITNLSVHVEIAGISGFELVSDPTLQSAIDDDGGVVKARGRWEGVFRRPDHIAPYYDLETVRSFGPNATCRFVARMELMSEPTIEEGCPCGK